ncbi:transcriptional regulator [Comamonas testosteroni]|uniref:Transcriptional regulator n=1 Tax=Comamonas testosteroni TaxID=285 RepID=A0A373FRL5_COMTE|nr:ogr/Delta-like zinc finger family protein [Comamonas testosteroni]RGE46145.1 transcriptional regulator [Comamonas testosteroni]
MYASDGTTPPAEGFQVLTFPRKGGKKVRSEGTRMACPHCGFDSVIRTSWMMTKLMRETTYQCSNPECSHSFIALTEIVRTLSPSATPDPTINIPLSSHVRRDGMRVVLDNADTAAHTPRYTPPVTGDLFASQPAPQPHIAGTFSGGHPIPPRPPTR